MSLPTSSVSSEDLVRLSADRVSAASQALLAMMLGALIIFVSGFSHIERVHNAAHDTRHANGFPCH